MCRCIEGMNRSLALSRHRLVTTEADDGVDGPTQVPVIATRPIDEEEHGQVAAIARFCPFCGERLRGKEKK